MSTATAEEDTLTVRTDTVDGLVELVTLDVGDEFETDRCGGVVVWKVNSGSAKAVDVIFDGHSKPISIAPSLKVLLRKKHNQVATTVLIQETVNDAVTACEPYEPVKPPAVKPARPETRVVVLRPLAPNTTIPNPSLHVHEFSWTLTPEDIASYKFSSAKNMFCTAIMLNWTKESTFEMAKAKFPEIKAGQTMESCIGQINLYKSLLRKHGRIQ